MKWYDWILRIAAVLLVVGIIVHAILTFLTAPGSEAAVADLRGQLASTNPSEKGPSSFINATASPAAPAPGNNDDVRERWLRLNKLVEERFHAGLCMCIKDEYDEVFDLIDSIVERKKQLSELTEPEFDLLRNLCAENEDILAELLALTQQDMPICHFDWFAHPRVRDIAMRRLLIAGLVLDDSDGYHNEAVEKVVALFRIAMADSSTWWGGKYYSFLVPVVRNSVESETTTEETRDRLLGQLTDVADHELFEESLSRMSDMVLRFYDNLPRTDGNIVESVWGWSYRYMGQPILNDNKHDFCKEMGQILQLAPLPYWEAEPELERLEHEGMLTDEESLYIWQMDPRAFSSYISSFGFEGQAHLESTANLLRLGILLEQYKREHDQYPERLDALADAFGGTLPVNAFTGEPYDYHSDKNTFSLAYTYQDDKGEEKTVEW